MKYFIIIAVFFIFGCGHKPGIELEILTKQVNCLNIKPEQYSSYRKSDTIAIKESRTIVTYRIKNNTTKTYYFNLDTYTENLENSYIKFDRAYLGILDQNQNNVMVRPRQPSKEFESKFLYLDYLDYTYDHNYNSKNFIIHPEETLYFEWFVVLPSGNFLEDTNYSVTLDPNERYNAEIIIKSDSTNFKKYISRTDIKTMEDNGYEIYHGIIKSKNKIPLVFHDLPDY